MNKNIFYIPHIHKTNGIMTFIYNIAKKYKDWDIVVYYKDCDSPEQLKRLKQFVKVSLYTNQKITCNKAFFNSDIGIINNVKANEYNMILHTNYKEQLKNGVKPTIDKRITNYYGVSKLVCDTFEKVYGIKAKPLYTPIELEEPKRVLRLVSFTRLDTNDKAKNNYINFANMLDSANIPYQWLIFTNDTVPIRRKGVCYMEETNDVSSYMKDADYVVQLSEENVEGFSLTINEALSLGVPIISTPQAVYEELGIDEKYGFIIDFDTFDIPIDDIYEKAGTFKFVKEPPKDGWSNVLEKGKTTYDPNAREIYLVEALDTYKINNHADATLKRVPDVGEQWEVDGERLEILLGNNELKMPYVKIVEKIKNEKPKKEKKTKRNNPFVSVIIPVYNQEKLITKAINSIPKRDDIEIIVIDDKSTDNTLNVLKKMKRKINIIANEVNKGVGYTFNQGLNNAKGEYIIRMDSDDYMYPNVFNDMVDNDLDGTDMVYYDLEINNGKILPTTRQNRSGRCGTVKFMRREFIGDTRCPEIRTAEDKYFNDALLYKQPTEKFTNKVLIHYNYPREGSLYDLTVKGMLR